MLFDFSMGSSLHPLEGPRKLSPIPPWEAPTRGTRDQSGGMECGPYKGREWPDEKVTKHDDARFLPGVGRHGASKGINRVGCHPALTGGWRVTGLISQKA